MSAIVLDAATDTPRVGVCHNGALLAGKELDGGLLASRTLLPELDTLLAQCGVQTQGLAYVACGAGPGSFTGMRAGCALALGLSIGLGIPLVGVPSGLPLTECATRAHEAFQRGEGKLGSMIPLCYE